MICLLETNISKPIKKQLVIPSINVQNIYKKIYTQCSGEWSKTDIHPKFKTIFLERTLEICVFKNFFPPHFNSRILVYWGKNPKLKNSFCYREIFNSTYVVKHVKKS